MKDLVSIKRDVLLQTMLSKQAALNVVMDMGYFFDMHIIFEILMKDWLQKYFFSNHEPPTILYRTP